MIAWTDAAIEAAIRGWFDTDDAFRPRMRAALDAAVQAQGMTAGWINRAVDDAYQEGRADALEEAALLVKASVRGYFGENIANSIRALKDAKP